MNVRIVGMPRDHKEKGFNFTIHNISKVTSEDAVTGHKLSVQLSTFRRQQGMVNREDYGSKPVSSYHIIITK